MAFSIGNPSAAGGVGGLTQGDNLPVIQTEGLGFKSLAGDAKVQLTSRWSPPPTPTAHLISIASRKGLVAAAGPDAVHIATTESVRKAFESPKDGDSEVRPFEPQSKLLLPFRISQLAFTADEKYLILSAETGGGLAIYDAQALTTASPQSAFELSTNNQTLRALIPNPNPELAGVCAFVTTEGNLLMANLEEKTLVSGANGPVLRSQVSCAAWSTKGKQLVAGMADGSIYQMTPDGTEKAHIPKPPSLGDYHVSMVAWLENHVFLTVHNPANREDPAVYHLITRQQSAGAPATFTYRKLTDPVEPFTAEKVPHHAVLRLKDFPPNLQDLLLVSSTATETIGLLTRSKTPLTSETPAETITDVFTTTELVDDSRRAQLPMSDDFNETYPIGSALDLSSKEKVYQPIPSDTEIELSPGPLPGLWVLNNEGVLASWWIVYNESIRAGSTYPEISAILESTAGQVATSTALPSAFSTPASSGPAFGAAAPAFGQSSFGSKPSLGSQPSPWAAGTPASGSSVFGSKPTFGTSSFGSPSAAPAFGQSSSIGMGQKASPWAAATTSTAAPAFGQSGFSAGTTTPGKVFGGGAAPALGTSGGFSSFADKGGFGSLSKSSGGGSIWGSNPGAPLTSAAPEDSMNTDTAFPPPSSKFGAKADGPPTLGTTPFVLGSTFKRDPESANDNEPKDESGNDDKATQSKEKSLFGGGFSLSLDNAAAQQATGTKDEDMDVQTPAATEEKPKSIFDTGLPAQEKPKPSLFGTDHTAQKSESSIFGTDTPAQAKPKPSLFGLESTTPKATPASEKFDFKSASGAGSNIFGKPFASGPASLFGPSPISSGAPSNIFGTPQVKKEEEEDKENLENIPSAPLPPDTTSKAVFPFGDFSSSSSSSSSYSQHTAPQKVSSKTDDGAVTPSSPPETTTPKPGTAQKDRVIDNAPLPPDFLAKPSTESSEDIPPVPSESDLGDLSDEEDEGDGEDDEGTELGSEGSGIDVAKDLSPTTGFPNQTPGFTPQSSFGGMAGSTFSTISRSEAGPLFGEIKNAPPLFPKPVVPNSPRSPSPMRPGASVIRPSIFRESARSVSAPGLASQFLGRKSQPGQTGLGSSIRYPPVDPNVEAQRKLAAAKREAEEKLLVDPEDEGIQEILHSELQPTLHIDEFLAVDQKLEVERAGREDVPAACELLWRDINRMIDRLGLNSRSLQSFILGHSQYKETSRHKEDLENPDDWVLVEAEDLGMLIDDELARDLEDGRIKDFKETQDAIHAISRDLGKLHAKEEDMRRIIMTQTDPDQVALLKSMPLSAEQSTQQNELRRAYNNFAKLLADTEEALTMLRTKLASAGGALGKTPVPTVEAIIRTINKMTSMAEKRSGDVDVLENQMRRLRFSSMGLNGSPAPRSREGSPFVGGAGLSTPQKRASMMSPERMRDSVASSGGRGGGGGFGTPRKKLSMFTEEEKRAAREKMNKRKNMLGLLRSSLEKAGPNVSRLRDDD